MKKKTPETMLKNSIKDLLEYLRIYNFPVLQGFGAHKGISDRIAIYNGRFVAIEVKAPKGKLSEDQKKFLADVEAAGGLSIVARSPEDVIEALGVQDRFLRFK